MIVISPGAAAAWLEQATTSWMPVMEARPEVTRRRDSGSSAAWLAGKRVLVLGCGALGAPAAEICVRAGAAEVTVADNGVVGPGILVRQPYEDSDIGQFKALALARRLNQIHADERVSALPQDIITTVLTDEMPASQFDLIIDAAANAAVTSRLEYCRAQSPGDWPAVLTMIIGHDARRGIVALARPGASGAGRDILRKLGLAACGDQAGQLADIRDDFFPESPRAEFFQPEPGCSDPTFTGSAAETGALAAHLMTAGLDALAGRAGPHADQPLSAAVVRLDAYDGAGVHAGTRWLGWPDDAVAADEAGGYEVRISPAAIREMRAESARGARVRGREHRDRRHAPRARSMTRAGASGSTRLPVRRPTAGCRPGTSSTVQMGSRTSSSTTWPAVGRSPPSLACGTPTPTTLPDPARPTRPECSSSSHPRPRSPPARS